jgi:hypothetical protein
MIERGRSLGGEAHAAQLAAAEALIAGCSGGNPMLDSTRMALAACKADVAGVRRLANEVATAYPNNPDVLCDAGSKLGMAAGDWAQAAVLEARAMALPSRMGCCWPTHTSALATLVCMGEAIFWPRSSAKAGTKTPRPLNAAGSSQPSRHKQTVACPRQRRRISSGRAGF